MDEGTHRTAERIAWPDTAKGIGIVLMYYGHVLACLPSIESDRAHGASLEEMRFIYAFHMPLFFMLAGLFFRAPRDPAARRRELAVRRLAPVLFFSLLLLPLWLAGPLRHGLSPWPELAPMLEGYLRGHPGLDWVTWFLVCLFVCECMAMVVLPKLHSAAAQCAGGLVSIWVGVLACNHAQQAASLFGLQVSSWFVYEALVALGFYMLGHALAPAFARLARDRAAALALGALGLVLAGVSYRWNGMAHQLPVMMAAGRHGEPLMFTLTALAGSVGVVGLAIALSAVPLLARLGRQSLVLLGLSGLFFHFVNARVEALLPPSESALPLTAYALLLSALSLAVALPVAERLVRWMPRWLGQPGRAAPADSPLAAHAP